MYKIIEWLKAIASALGGVAAYIWGPADALIITLVCLAVFDYITGVAKAAIRRELSSGAGFKGLMKKVTIFVLVGLAALVDRIVPAANGAVRSAVIMFYIMNEGLSIVENAGGMGLPLPEKLSDALRKLHNGGGE